MGDSMAYLLALSLIPSVILCYYIYSKDVIEKEPISLLIKLFIAGIASVFLVFIISDSLELIFPILTESSKSLKVLLIQNFLGVALIEEFCKWIFLLVCTWRNRNFNFLFDGIVYAVFVSLGFATFENLTIVYSLKGLMAILLRAVISVPAHAFFGVFMGYYYGLAKKKKNSRKGHGKYLLLSLIVPILLHSFFDFCLAVNNIIYFIVFIVFVVLLYISSFKAIIKTAKDDHKIGYR